MKWCCHIFQGWFQMAGSRGLGVFVSTREQAEPSFILQFRALDPGKPVPHTNYPLSSVSQIHLQFCPLCGVDDEVAE
jgi:hypothetical protein